MTSDTVAAPAPSRRRTLAVCGGAHALHDGYTDLLGILLPLLQAQFALSYTAVGALRTIYAFGMAGGQIPAGLVAERVGGRFVLALGTALSALGYLVAGLGGGLAGAVLGIALSGLGSSTQHPIASSLVAAAHDDTSSRTAIGTYNFAGDVGKVVIPASFALLASLVPWQSGLLAVAGLGLAAALMLPVLIPPALDRTLIRKRDAAAASGAVPTGPFRLLLAIGMTDSMVRAGFLTFLPFLLASKGASLSLLGLALSLLFAGGAAGKLVCGWLGHRFGMLPVVIGTEALTALTLLAALPLPLEVLLVLLPILGIALNGTSSVLYGTVPELVAPERRARAFAVFYTAGSLAGGLGPLVGGALGDTLGLATMIALLALCALATIPLAVRLRPSLG
ncbi:MAG: MFS transporter [Alphaproteobacteria bacterium]|nr:MFS transporter [Alphaproteobacteria bacterium]